MARSYEGDISVVVGADTGPADKKIDALFNKIEALQHVNIDGNISNLQRKLSTMAKRTNAQMSAGMVRGMLKDFKTVLGAMKSEFETNGIDTVIYKSLDKTVREVESRLSNLSVSVNGKQIAGLEQILNSVADLEAINDFKFEAIISQQDVKNSEKIVQNVKETKKALSSLVGKIEYVGKTLAKDVDSALSEQKLKGYEQRILGLQEQLKSFGEIDNPLIQQILKNATTKATEVLEQISLKQAFVTKKQTEATHELVGANNDVGEAAENASKKADKAVRKTVSTLDKAIKKYNEIMGNLELGDKTIGTPFSKGTNNWGLSEMLNEVKQIYDTYYEIGHKNQALKTENYKMWQSHTTSLRGFLSSYAKYYEGSAEAIYNKVQKKKEEYAQYKAQDWDNSVAGNDEKYLAFKQKDLELEEKRLQVIKDLVKLSNKYQNAPLFAWKKRPDLDKDDSAIDVSGLAGKLKDYEEGLEYSRRTVERIVKDVENKKRIANPQYTPMTADGSKTAWGSTDDPNKAYKYIRDQHWSMVPGVRLDLNSMAQESPDEASRKYLETRREITDILKKEKLEYQDIIKLLEAYNQKSYQTLTQSRYIADAINMAADIEAKIGRGSDMAYDNYLTVALNSLNEPGKLMSEYIEMYASQIAKILGVAVKKEVQKPELLQHIDVLDDKEEMYDAKTVAQKRKVAEEYLKAQFRLYREMKAEYEGGDEVHVRYGTDYDMLLRQQNMMEAYVALYEKYGGKIEKLSKGLQEFIEFNGFAGQYQYALDEYHAAMSASEQEVAAPVANTVKEITGMLHKLHDITGHNLREYLDMVQRGVQMSKDAKEILTALKLIDEFGNFVGNRVTDGLNNHGVIMNDTHAIIQRDPDFYEMYDDRDSWNFGLKENETYLDKLISKMEIAEQRGVSLAKVLTFVQASGSYSNMGYDVQELASGESMHIVSNENKNKTLDNFEKECERIVNAKAEHIQKLMKDAVVLNDLGFDIDFGAGNVLYDAEKGFTFIDLALRELGVSARTTTQLMESLFRCLSGLGVYQDVIAGFTGTSNIAEYTRYVTAMESVLKRLNNIFVDYAHADLNDVNHDPYTLLSGFHSKAGSKINIGFTPIQSVVEAATSSINDDILLELDDDILLDEPIELSVDTIVNQDNLHDDIAESVDEPIAIPITPVAQELETPEQVLAKFEADKGDGFYGFEVEKYGEQFVEKFKTIETSIRERLKTGLLTYEQAWEELTNETARAFSEMQQPVEDTTKNIRKLSLEQSKKMFDGVSVESLVTGYKVADKDVNAIYDKLRNVGDMVASGADVDKIQEQKNNIVSMILKSVTKEVDTGMESFFDEIFGGKIFYDSSEISEIGKNTFADVKSVLSANKLLTTKSKNGLRADEYFHHLSSYAQSIISQAFEREYGSGFNGSKSNILQGLQAVIKHAPSKFVEIPDDEQDDLRTRSAELVDKVIGNVEQLLKVEEAVTDEIVTQNKVRKTGDKQTQQPKDKVVDLLEKNTLKTIEQISAAERRTRTGHDFDVSTTEELEQRFSQFAETLSGDTGLKIGKIKVGTHVATLELYNDELKTAVRYTYQLTEAAKGEATQLELVNEVYEQNIKALQENKFDAAGYKAIAKRAVEELRASLKGIEAPEDVNFGKLNDQADDITSKDKWTAFNNQVKAAKKSIDTLKQSISTSNSMNTLVSAVRGMENAENTIRDYQVELNQLGNIPGIDKAQQKIDAMAEAVRKYKEEATTGNDQVKFFNEFNDAEVAFKSQLSGLRKLTGMTNDMSKADITLRRMELALEDFKDVDGYGDAVDAYARMSEALQNFNGTDDVAQKALAHKQYTSAESELKSRMTALRELNKEYSESQDVFGVQDKLYNQRKKLVKLQLDESTKDSDLQVAERKTAELEQQYEASLMLLKTVEDYNDVKQRELQLEDELSTVMQEQYRAQQDRIAAAELEAEETEKEKDIKLYEDEQDELAKARLELQKERDREQKEQKEAQDALEKTKKIQDQLYVSKKKLVELQLDESTSESELQVAERKTQELEQQYDSSLRLLKTEEDYIKVQQRELQLEDELSSVMFEQRAAQLQRLENAEEKALASETQQEILRHEQEQNTLEKARLEIQKEQATEQKKQKENQEELLRLQKLYNEADYKWHQADIDGSDKTPYNEQMESYVARMKELRQETKLTAEQQIELNKINTDYNKKKQNLLGTVAKADSKSLAELQTFSRWESDIKNVGMISDETAERIRNMRAAIDGISDNTDVQKLAEDFKVLKADVKYETTQSKTTKTRIADIKASLKAEQKELKTLYDQLDLDLDLGDAAPNAKQIEQSYNAATEAIKKCTSAVGEQSQEEIAAAMRMAEAAKEAMQSRQDAEHKWWYGSDSDAKQPFDENQIKQWHQSLNATIQQINKIETKMHDLMKKDGGTGAWAPLIESLESQRSALLDRVRDIGKEINTAFGGQFVLGNQVDLPFSSILSGIQDFDASGVITDFFSDIRTQTVLSEQSIEKFVATLQGAQNKTEEFSTWMKEGIYSALQSSETTLANLYQRGMVDTQNDKYKLAVQELQEYQKAILTLTDKSTGKLTDPSSWTSQQVIGILEMTNSLSKYTSEVQTGAAAEAKYFEAKKQYANISTLQGYDEMASNMDKISNGTNDARAKLEQFVAEFEGGQKIITGFTTSADGISRIDFSVLEEGSGHLRNFSAEMGQFTNNIYTVESSLKNMDAGTQAVKNSLSVMHQLMSRLNVRGMTADNNEYVAKLREQIDVLNALYMELGSSKDLGDQVRLQNASMDAERLISTLKTLEKAWLDVNYAANDESSGTHLLGTFDKNQDSAEQFANSLKVLADKMDGTVINVGDFNGEIKKIPVTIETAGGEIKNFIVDVEKLGSTITASLKSTEKAKTGWQEFGASFGGLGKEILKYGATLVGVYDFVRYLRQGFNEVLEIDTAMTELKKVTEETDVAYSNFLKNAYTSSKKIGTTMKDFTQATADFARLGYNLDEASSLAEAANVYMNVGDGIDNVEDASKSIISTMKAFSIEAEGAMGIVDRFNEVGNNFAIDSVGIGDALQRSASALAEAGNTIDESIALVTGANTVVQNPEQVGTALKTLALRLRGAKVELEEAGLETDNMAESTATLQAKLKALTHGKVDIMLDADTFKSTTQILREMADAWEHMTDIERASALELMGGKRQANILSSLITNFDIVENVITTSMDSANSAIEENAKYLDSMQGRIDQLTNSLQSMWVNALDSDMLKGFISLVDVLVQAADKAGLLNVAISAFMAKTAFDSNKFGILNMIPSLANAAADSMIGLGMSAKAVGIGFDIMNAAATAGISILAGLLISGIAKLVSEAYKSAEEIEEAANKITNAYKNAQETLSSNKKTIDSISGDYEKLSAGVDGLGNNISLTTDEYTRYNEIVNQIADMFPQMVSGYTAEGNAILSTKGNVEALTQAYKEQAEAARNAVILGGDDVFADAKNKLEDAKEQIDAYNVAIEMARGATVKSAKDRYGNSVVDDAIAILEGYGFKQNYKQYASGTVHTTYGLPTKWNNRTQQYENDYTYEEEVEHAERINKLMLGRNDLLSQQQTYLSKVNTVLQAYLDNNATYAGMEEEAQSAISSIVSALDPADFNYDDDEMEAFILSKIIAPIHENKDGVQDALNSLLSLDENETSYQVYEGLRTALLTAIASLPKDTQDAFKKAFGLGGDSEYSTYLNHAKEVLQDDFDDMASELTLSDLKLLDKLGIPEGTLLTWDELKQKIAEVKSTLSSDIASVQTYSALAESVESYNDILTQTAEIVSNNTEVTQEYKDAVKALGVSEDELSECFDDNNGLVVKNAKALNKLVKTASKNVATNVKLAKSQARLEYYDLVKQLNNTMRSTNVLDVATRDSIQSTLDQIDAVEKALYQYQLLEDTLLGVNNAFDKFAKAQEIDSMNTYGDSYVEMAQTMYDALYKTGQVGTEAFWSSVESLVPDSVYQGLTDDADRMKAIYDYYNKSILPSLRLDNDSLSLDYDAVENFVKEGLASGVFTGDTENFNLVDGMNLEKAAELMGMTKTQAYALFAELDKYNAAGNEHSFLSQLDDSIEGKITKVSNGLEDLNRQKLELLSSGGYKQNQQAIDEINAKIAQSEEELHQLGVQAYETWQTYTEIDAVIAALGTVENKQRLLTQNEANTLGIKWDEAQGLTVQQAIDYLIAKKLQLEEPTILTAQLSIDSINSQIAELEAQLAEAEKNPATFPIQFGSDIETEKQNLRNKIQQLKDDKSVIATTFGIELSEEDKKTIQEELDNIEQFTINDKTFWVRVNGTSEVMELLQAVNKYAKDETKTVTTVYKTVGKPSDGKFAATYLSEANGTAHAYGTAHANGSWGAPKTETALVGELGPEMLVRNGRWTTVGDNGAEFTQVKKGDIIFNHKQTEDLLSKGYVTGRGKLHGGAFASGTAYSGLWKPTSPDKSLSNDPGKDFSNAASDLNNAADSIGDASDKFREVFDWIEVRLEEINESISLNGAQLENKIGYSEQNKVIDKMIDLNQKLYDNLISGANEYYAYAQKLLEKVPAAYRDAAQDGTIAIEAFTKEADKETIEAIQEYRDWVQKGADLTQQAEETLTEISNLAKQAIDNISNAFENVTSLTDSKIEQLEAYNALLETDKGFESEGIYQKLIDANNDNIEQLKKQREEMQKELNAQIEAGNIKVGSQDWYDAVNDIAAVDTEIIELTTDTENYQDAINELHWDKFDALMSRLESVSDEAENLIDILSNKDLVDEAGNWTDEGITSLGLYAQQMEAAEVQAKKYQEEIDYLNKNWQELGYTEQEYIEKLDELKDGQYDAIKAYHDSKDAIVDLNKERIDAIKKGIEKEIEAYEELIKVKKEELDAEKDMYDFQKSAAEKQKNIDDIRRKLDALSGDNSASARAKRAQLEADLAEALAEQEELYYDRSIQDQQDALDKELENFQEAKDKEMEGWDEYLENTEQVVSDSLATVQANTDAVYQTLMAMGEEYGLSITESITSPWEQGAIAIQSFSEQFGLAMSSTVEELEKLELEFKTTMSEIESAGIDAANAVKDNTQGYTEAQNPVQESNSNSSSSSNNSGNSNASASTAGLVSSISGTIYQGQTGDRVKKLQQALNELGYGNYGTTGLDGIFGSGTLAAVKAFQSAMGLDPDGRVGPKTKEQFKLKGYAKGSKGIAEDQLALIDELGEELQLIPDKNGRLSYMKKGTGIVPADLTTNLMGWGKLDPSIMLDQNRPQIGVSPSVVNNTTEIHIDASVGELLHVEHIDGNNPTEISKIVDKAWDKHMKELNAHVRRYTNR